MDIKFKILTPLVAFIFICLAALLATSVLVYNSTLDEAASKRLDVSIKSIEAQIDRYKEISKMAAIQLAEKPEFKKAVKAKDHKEIVRIVNDWLDFSKVEYGTIKDENDVTLARTHILDYYGDTIVRLPENENIYIHDSYTSVMRTRTTPLVIATNVRIYDDDNKFIGSVLTGFRLDNPKYVDNLKEITGNEISIFLGESRLSTTLMNEDSRFTRQSPEYAVHKKVLAGDTYSGRTNIFNKPILTKYIPLKGPNDFIIGMLAVGEFTEIDDNKKEAFLAKGLFIAFIALIVIVVIVMLIASAIEKQLKDAATELQEANEHVQVMFDSNPIVCTLFDENLNIKDCNLETLNFFGLESKQDFFDSFYKLSPQYQQGGENSRDLIAWNIKRAFDMGDRRRFEWMHQTIHGELRPAEIILVRVKYNKKNMIAAYIRDLRREKEFIKKLEQEISEKVSAENVSKAKSAFFAKISHEIRTPMNAILGISEILLRNKSLNLETQTAISKIYDAGHFLLNLINDVLDLSKIEAEKMELSSVKYEIASLINDTVHLNIMRNSKPIELVLDLDENTPFSLVGDELRIKQILNNLLSNAFKYTDEGVVKLTVRPKLEEDGETRLYFTISDTGKGMTQSQIDKIFEDYSRFDGKNNSNITGTGLGMSIVKNLVRMMKGEINVESEVGKGTTITVEIPQKSLGPRVLGKELAARLNKFKFNSNAIKRKKQQINYEPMPYGKVLLVDDVETNLYVAKGLLIPYQLEIEMVASGKAAIDKIKKGKTYDIIFMDHMMPEMDGIEATKIIRGLGYNEPIIALTANAVAGQAEMFLKEGFNDFLSKPIDMRQMNEVLNKLIRNKQSHATIEEARKNKKEVQVLSGQVANDLLEIFAIDAKKAIENISAILENIETATEQDLKLFAINVHAMKGALSNINEPQYAKKAFALEDAAKNGKKDIIKNSTEEFLDILKSIIFQVETNSNKKEVLTEDKEYLRTELKKVSDACSNYDKKTAKDTLAEIRKKPWTKETTAILEKIAENLLHSDFDIVIEEIGKV